MDTKVFDFLPYGKENAISSKALTKALGFQNIRDLQKKIERERAAGAVILSTDQNGGGYFLSNDPDELRRFTRTLNARAKHTLRAAESAKRALDAAAENAYSGGRQDGEK